jgi:chromosome segregation ATPase
MFGMEAELDRLKRDAIENAASRELLLKKHQREMEQTQASLADLELEHSHQQTNYEDLLVIKTSLERELAKTVDDMKAGIHRVEALEEEMLVANIEFEKLSATFVLQLDAVEKDLQTNQQLVLEATSKNECLESEVELIRGELQAASGFIVELQSQIMGLTNDFETEMGMLSDKCARSVHEQVLLTDQLDELRARVEGVNQSKCETEGRLDIMSKDLESANKYDTCLLILF